MFCRLLTGSMIILGSFTATAASYHMNQAPPVTTDQSWYFGGFGGVGFISDISDTDTVGDVNKRHFDDNAWQAGFQIGYEFETFRLECQYAYFDGEVSHVSENGVNVTQNLQFSESINVNTLMTNFILDFNSLSGSYTIPYAGFGVGYADVQTDVNVSSLGVTYNMKRSLTEFAYQAILGVTVPLNSSLNIFADYRFFATSNIGALSEAYQNHTLNLGVNFRFDGDYLS